MRNQPEPAIRFRPAQSGEAELLSALALRSKAVWGYSPQFIEACRDELTYSEAQLVDPRFVFVVAEDGAGKTAGFYALEWISGGQVELEALFVEPAHIGRGVGRALIEHAKAVAAAAGSERMLIQGDSHAAAFYRAAGGLPVGERESASIPGRRLPLFVIALGAGAQTD